MHVNRCPLHHAPLPIPPSHPHPTLPPPPPQGYLEFDEGLTRMDSLLAELPDSYASKGAALARGMDLCFCYANPIPGEGAGWGGEGCRVEVVEGSTEGVGVEKWGRIGRGRGRG